MTDPLAPRGWSPTAPQRLAGLSDAEMTPRAREALATWWPPFNIHRVLVRNPPTLSAWIGFGSHILRENLLGELRRELVVLRIAWNARCDYEWGQHAGLSARLGLPEAVIERVTRGPDATEWTELEAALLRGVDELMERTDLDDATYATLAAELSPEQLIDYVFLIGEFVLVAMTLNMFRIQPDPGLRPIPRPGVVSEAR